MRKLVDISPSGARISIHQRIPVRSVITFYHYELGIGGRGTVRSCRLSGRATKWAWSVRAARAWGSDVLRNADLLNLAALLGHDQPISISPGVAAEPGG